MPNLLLIALMFVSLLAGAAVAELPDPTGAKPATDATRAANAAMYEMLPFEDRQAFEDAQRGFIARPDPLTIRNANGRVVWDMESYRQYIGLDIEAPDTVNPSLWRNAQLNLLYGLFKVTDRIYQVRGYDISNITFVEGDTGWIVIDPLTSTETAQAALELVNEHLGARPVVAVMYSHTHVDHYGGVRGIISQTDDIPIVAPAEFMEHAVKENVIAGNAMKRRAMYMFGGRLPRNPRGSVSAGLGQTISQGTVTLIAPTISIHTTGQELTIDGIRMVFQMTPGTEAPAEMNTWFPDFKAMWMAENITATLHNILTLRGAEVRDALNWAKYLNETILLFGAEMEVTFQSHHWPVWGNARAVKNLKAHRDIYKYLHDQTVNLMNKGYTGEEIAEILKLPPELERNWSTRGHYGTIRHNSRAIYQRYMGWYDGNPANLNNLPTVLAARRYVEYMGGTTAILARARTDFERGDYRWVAEVLKHVVLAHPDHQEARNLQADAFEQMGYQAESGSWRAVYLQGAYELRHGVPDLPAGSSTATSDVITAMTPEMLFDYLAVRLNGPKAFGKQIALNIRFTDLDAEYGLVLENAVINYGPPVTSPNLGMTLAKSTLNAILLQELSVSEAVASGALSFYGTPDIFGEFMQLLEPSSTMFNIVTPRDASLDPDIIRLFEWLESTFPTLLAPAPQTTRELGGIYYRYYPNTQVYIGIMADHLYLAGPRGELHDLGPVAYWQLFAQGQCREPLDADPACQALREEVARIRVLNIW